MLAFDHTTWRLLQSPAQPGAWNMALDEAIFEAAGRGEVLPTLRLYAWQPACLSLGYGQPITDVDLEALAAQGWGLVRRPTGGRAILHIDELTYSVSGPQDEPRLRGSILESYRTLSAALLAGLLRLGIQAQAFPKNGAQNSNTGGGEQNPVCFERPSDYEITVDGKKLIGSAQARRNFFPTLPAEAVQQELDPNHLPGHQQTSDQGRGGVLQHGSLPLSGDLSRITQALIFADQDARQRAAERLLQRATTAELALGWAPSWSEAAEALRTAFEETLDLELEPGEITLAEEQRAGELFQEKYSSRSWNEKC